MQNRFLVSVVTSVALIIGSIFVYNLNKLRVVTFQGHIMGTTYTVKYVTKLAYNFNKDPAMAVYHALNDVDQRMSTYKPNSELMRLNGAYVGEAIKVSPDLAQLIKQSQIISKMSGGSYDVTAGTLVNLWGFGAINSGEGKAMPDILNEPAFLKWIENNQASRVPTKQEVLNALSRVGYNQITVDLENSTITRNSPVFIDLSSIAKGYSVDRAAAILDQLNINSYMIEVGGEILVKGNKPDGSPWRIAIQQPDLTGPNKIIELKDSAIATSGDYLNYFEADGKHYSHLINAKTGYPEQHNLASVAVIHKDTATADALATMFMILGEVKGMTIAKRENIAAYFIIHTDNGFISATSPEFEKYLN